MYILYHYFRGPFPSLLPGLEVYVVYVTLNLDSHYRILVYNKYSVVDTPLKCQTEPLSEVLNQAPRSGVSPSTTVILF